MTNQLDHIAIGATSLSEGYHFFQSAFGVDIPLGGKHAMMGTHNRLMKLQGASYFELISIDENAHPPQRPRWFGLDEAETHAKLSRKPSALSWIVQTTDLDRVIAHSPIELGEVLELQRDDLRWRLTVPKDGKPVMGGLIPAFIEWPKNMHPSRSLPDLAVTLDAITLSHPDPSALNEVLDKLEISQLAQVAKGETNLSFTFSSPAGRITID